MKEDFKIIAIRPLEKCNPDYSKVLKRGELYTFYNEYKIDVESDTITYNESVPSDLYDVNDIKINISAIVGKNGEGKSTLVELILMTLNNIIHKAKTDNKIKTVNIEYVRRLHVEMYYLLDGLFKIQIKDNQLFIFKYQKSNNIFFSPIEIDFKDSKEFNLKDFFYTIGTNYSHYALNSRDFGGWIYHLFHKNDAYQAPIVINPYRKEGNIDINSENDLVKARLLSLLLNENKNKSNRMLTDRQLAKALIFKLNKGKFKYIYKVYEGNKETEISFDSFYGKNIDKKIIVDLLFSIFEKDQNIKKSASIINDFSTVDLPKNSIEDYAIDYIIKKLVSISLTYEHYFGYFNIETGVLGTPYSNSQFKDKKLQEYFNKLYKDKSHITLKLRQAINFIRCQTADDFKDIIDEIPQTKSIDDYSFILQLRSKKFNTEIIELLPPSFIESDIELVSYVIGKDGEVIENKLSDDEIVRFSHLSSGEKQLIFTVSSIIYHLNNLITVDVENSNLVRYRCFNLIFEEIELYFHPDLQRRFIKYLLDRLKNQFTDNINGINMCFATHSPFILSDIPSQNILFLQLNEKDNKSYSVKDSSKTFGTNIHDLLANSFYLQDGFMGEYAKTKLENIIGFLNDRSNKVEISSNKKDILKIIELIGEPFLREKLKEMFYNKFTDLKNDRIKELENELEKLIPNDRVVNKQ